MTKVYIATNGEELVLAAQGHATGSVEACAGVSAILYALAGFVINEMPGAATALKLEPGKAEICCPDTEKLRTAFEMAAIGLAQIAAGTETVEIYENL